jgi:fluoroacetyl-CoA thioesterase
MEFSELIKPGTTNEETFEVTEEYLASHIGSGAARVLATPWLILFMERVSHRLIAQRVPEGYSSVGAEVNMRHLAPTPLGGKVRVVAEVVAVEGSKVTLSVTAADETEPVGTCAHQRYIIDEARFLKRVAAKSGKLST